MIVADASAVLALLLGEAIHRLNPADFNGASISSVNLTEVLTRLCDLGIPGEAINASIAELNLRVISFDEMQARGAADSSPPVGSSACPSETGPAWPWPKS